MLVFPYGIDEIQNDCGELVITHFRMFADGIATDFEHLADVHDVDLNADAVPGVEAVDPLIDLFALVNVDSHSHSPLV
jgi:hypothetical protein